jgi:hypothetical protein
MTTEITIPLQFGQSTQRKAVIRGEWALHRTVNLPDGYYTLTHLPTGRGIDWLYDKPVALAHALRRVARVGPPPVNPAALKPATKRRPHPAGYTAWIGQIVAAVGPSFKPPFIVDFVGEEAPDA